MIGLHAAACVATPGARLPSPSGHNVAFYVGGGGQYGACRGR